MVSYIDDHKDRFGVESICRQLPIAPSTYYEYKAREYKAEVIRTRGPWREIDAVEHATLTWVDWFNNRSLLEPIGDIPPIELEKAYYEQLDGQAEAA